MRIILIVVIVILLIIFLLFLLPIHYDLKLKKDGEVEVKTDINYPFDIIKFHLDYFLLMNYDLKIFGIKLLDKTIDPSYKDKTKLEKKHKKDEGTDKKKKGIVKKFLSLKLKQKITLISDLKKDITKILNKIKPKDNDITIELGLDNPFLLGALLGLLSAVKLVLKNMKIYPFFTEKKFKIDMELKSDIRLITLLIIVLELRFSKKYKALFE